MSKPKLTKDDFCRSAAKLKCEVAAIRAVAQVESRGDGFYPDGFPTILFERHKFRAFTHRRYDRTHPHISGPQGGYGPPGQNQRNKFSEAFRLHPEAAMMACSWGKFQVMGFNWDDLGYDSVHEFVDRMKISEGEHLEAFTRFVIANGLRDELQRLDFTSFARVYNGPAFRKNQYDAKMIAFYRKFKGENFNCDQLVSLIPEHPPVFDDHIAQDSSHIYDDDILGLHQSSTVEDPAGSHSSPPYELAYNSVGSPWEEAGGFPLAEPPSPSVDQYIGDPPAAPPSSWLKVEDWKPLVFRWLKRIWGGTASGNVTQAGAFTFAAANDIPNWYIYAIAGFVVFVVLSGAAMLVSLVLLAIWYFNRKEIAAAKTESAKSFVDPKLKNLGVMVEKK